MIRIWLIRCGITIGIVVFVWTTTVVEQSCAQSQDLSVAEWTILNGGTVRIEGQVERTREVSQLPKDDFRIDLIDLVGTNISPPDLVRLSDLKGLRFLYLPGPMWNPSAGARIDYSGDLKHIANIMTLEDLSFSYTYLESIKFQDDGLEAIKSLGPSLKKLSLENTAVKGRHLAAFTNLRSLDLVYCPVDDKGMLQLQGLTSLEELLLRDALISDSGLASIASLENLKALDLSGTALPLLKLLPKLRELSVGGQQRTDSGLWSVNVSDFNLGNIADLSELKVLDLSGTGISDRGVAQLAQLKKLESLDLSRTKTTSKGVAALAGILSLRYLKLGQSTNIDDSVFIACQKLKNLEVLELQETKITFEGLKKFSSKSRLKKLYIGGVAIRPEQVEAIGQVLPNCYLSWWPKTEIAAAEKQ